jgi:multisubunit Na+/H+ antiporter MnhE subunit
MIRVALAIAVLDAIYLLVVGSRAALDAAIGAVLAASVLVALRPYHRQASPRPRGRWHLARVPRAIIAIVELAGSSARDIVAGTVQVMHVVLGLSSASRAGVVTVPVSELTETEQAVSALVETLSPGSVVVDLDHRRQQMLLHVMDVTEADALRRRHREMWERYHARIRARATSGR